MKRTRIKPISPTKTKHNELYRKSKASFKKELAISQGLEAKATPLCQWCQLSEGTDLHHRAGRSGVLLWHKPLFAWLCRSCHNKVHFSDTKGAEQCGYIVRLTRDEYEEIRREEQPRLYE